MEKAFIEIFCGGHGPDLVGLNLELGKDCPHTCELKDAACFAIAHGSLTKFYLYPYIHIVKAKNACS
jgi:hypothetical protein